MEVGNFHNKHEILRVVDARMHNVNADFLYFFFFLSSKKKQKTKWWKLYAKKYISSLFNWCYVLGLKHSFAFTKYFFSSVSTILFTLISFCRDSVNAVLPRFGVFRIFHFYTHWEISGFHSIGCIDVASVFHFSYFFSFFFFWLKRFRHIETSNHISPFGIKRLLH